MEELRAALTRETLGLQKCRRQAASKVHAISTTIAGKPNTAAAFSESDATISSAVDAAVETELLACAIDV